MLEGSTAKINIFGVLNHKKHLIFLSMYGFLSRTLGTPYAWVAFLLIVISLIRDGIKHGGRQNKETDPNYLQVVQPIFLGIMSAVYLGIVIRVYQGALEDNGLQDIPQGDVILYFFIFVAACMALIFFPLIVSSMVTFGFYVPYYVGYKFGKYYWAKARSLKHDDMRAFLTGMKTESIENELIVPQKFD